MATIARPRRSTQINEGISAAILLALMLISLAGSVTAANWVDGLGLLAEAVLAGMLVGIVLAKLPLPGWLAHPLAILFALAGSLIYPLPLLVQIDGNRERVLFMFASLRDWTIKVLNGGSASDNLIFVVQVIFFGYLFSIWASWLVFRRHQVWGAICLIGSVLLLNLFYAQPQGNLYLIFFSLSALLLVVRMNLHALEFRWRNASIGYASDIRYDFFQYGIIFSLLLLSFAWLLPENAPGDLTVFDPIAGPWHNIEDQVTRVFGGVRAVERRAAGAFAGTALMMGGPIKLGDHPALDIQADGGRYWRSAVYDRYTGSGWISSHTDSLTLNASDPRIGVKRDDLRTVVTQTIQVLAPDPNNTLYFASEPIRFDLPVEVRYSKSISDQADFGFDLAYAHARRNLREGDTYTIVSALSNADEDSLRSINTNYAYPSWFTNDYLQLPDRIPRRVQDLARALTQGQATQYDKALAIEKYLRTKIKYNESVAAPPSGRDAVDYMLFDRLEGYCNYYASAMAVLARMAGIPARVASGYSLTDSTNGVYHVLEKDSHAWTELYFPNYGWIEFEPTASKPDIERPRKADSQQNDADNANALDEAERRRQLNADLPDDELNQFSGSGSIFPAFWSDPLNVAESVFGAAVLFAFVWGVIAWRKNRNQMLDLTPAARVYEEMLTRSRWLAVRDQNAATPLERAQSLAEKIPTASAETERIAAYYTREKFGAWKPRMTDRAALEISWGRVRAAWRIAMIDRGFAYVRSLPRAVQSRLTKILKRKTFPPDRLHPNR